MESLFDSPQFASSRAMMKSTMAVLVSSDACARGLGDSTFGRGLRLNGSPCAYLSKAEAEIPLETAKADRLVKPVSLRLPSSSQISTASTRFR